MFTDMGRIIAIAALLGCLTPSLAFARVYRAYDAPPPPREEVVVARPGHVWVRGHYGYRHRHYVWTRGRYVHERPGYTWRDGGWDHRERAYEWHPGRWEPAR